MEIEYDYWEGHLKIVESSLKRSVSHYLRNHKTIKIGITNNPERRMGEHLKGEIKWKRLVVKYKTSSVKYINAVEKILIEHHWDNVWNKVNGGGGPNGSKPYYLYFLLK